MTTATKPRIATPVKRERIVTSKPKSIKIGHAYYDLSLIKELVNTLPDGEVTLISHPSKPCDYGITNPYSKRIDPPRLECQYNRGHFTLNANDLPFYAADNGKVKPVRSLRYYQNGDLPAKVFSLLSVELPMKQGGVI